MLVRLIALVSGVVLIGVGVAAGFLKGQDERAELDRRLGGENRKEVDEVRQHFDRTRDLLLLTALNPSFAEFYREPGDRASKIEQGSRWLDQAGRALAMLGSLYRSDIGEICFVDGSGAENMRLLRGSQARPDELSTDERDEAYFKATIALPPGDVYQSPVYRSAETGALVVSSATTVPGLPAGQRAVIHLEVTMASFARIRQAMDVRYLIIDADAAAIVMDTAPTAAGAGTSGAGDTGDAALTKAVAQAAEQSAEQTSGRTAGLPPLPASEQTGAPAGAPSTEQVTEQAGAARGLLTVGDQRVAWERIPSAPTNGNNWIVVTAAPAPDTSWVANIDLRTLILVAAAMALFTFAIASFRGYQRRLELAALTDPLTKLANRRLLVDRLDQALLASGRTGADVGVLVLDLDGFKQVNDTFGHQAGDELLLQVGPRIRGELRDGDTVARLGGDEFAVLLPAVNGAAGAVEVAGRIATALCEPFGVGGHTVDVEASVGIAVAPEHGDDYETLMRRADTAMYIAKQSGRGVALFAPSAGQRPLTLNDGAVASAVIN